MTTSPTTPTAASGKRSRRSKRRRSGDKGLDTGALCDIILGMNSTPDNKMADVIRAAFGKSGISIKALSDRSGVHYAAVHAFVNGTRDPLLSTASSLCETLGLELCPVRRGKRKTKG